MTLRLRWKEGRYGFEDATAGDYHLSVGYAMKQDDGSQSLWSVAGDAGRFEVRGATITDAKQAAEDALHGRLTKALKAFGGRP